MCKGIIVTYIHKLITAFVAFNRLYDVIETRDWSA